MVSPPTPPHIVSAAEVERHLTPQRAFDSQREAFLSLHSGEAELAPRVLMPGVDGAPTTFSYLSRLRHGSGAVAKLGSVQPANSALGLPVVDATILCFDPETGGLQTIIDGASVTTIRTAAASAVALTALAGERRDLHVVVVGSGTQGIAHLEALARLDPVSSITLLSRSESTIVPGTIGAPCRIAVSRDTTVLRDADAVVLCTTSATPVLRLADVRGDTIVISIGSYSPELSEVDTDLVAAAALVAVDHRATAVEQAGPIVSALAAGLIDPEHIAEIGAVIAGETEPPDGLIFYNSVGIGVQDAAAAWTITQHATS